MIVQRRSSGGGGFFFSLIFIAIIMMLMFYSIKGIYYILGFFAPFLIIAAAFINFNVIRDYVSMIVDKIKSNFISGLVFAILSVVFYPFLAGFLFYKAINSNKKDRGPRRKAQKKKTKGEYIPYEELDDEPLDLDELRKQRKTLEELFSERETESEL